MLFSEISKWAISFTSAHRPIKLVFDFNSVIGKHKYSIGWVPTAYCFSVIFISVTISYPLNL